MVNYQSTQINRTHSKFIVPAYLILIKLRRFLLISLNDWLELVKNFHFEVLLCFYNCLFCRFNGCGAAFLWTSNPHRNWMPSARSTSSDLCNCMSATRYWMLLSQNSPLDNVADKHRDENPSKQKKWKIWDFRSILSELTFHSQGATFKFKNVWVDWEWPSDSHARLYYKIQGPQLQGRAVIINNNLFEAKKPREGSYWDAVNMLKALECLGFRVEIYENLAEENFYSLIRALSLFSN